MNQQSYVKALSAPVLLGALFITLKLCGVIDWSWWLVCLPLYLGWAIGLVLVAVYFLAIATYALAVGIVWLGAIIVAKFKSR